MRALCFSVVAFLLAFGIVPAFGGSTESGTPAPPVPRVFCAHPSSLGLHRFEDGSARLECVGRTLVRISVPG